eukprot:13646346-Heterocapsa_arctica.AAC.1
MQEWSCVSQKAMLGVELSPGTWEGTGQGPLGRSPMAERMEAQRQLLEGIRCLGLLSLQGAGGITPDALSSFPQGEARQEGTPGEPGPLVPTPATQASERN